MKRKWCISNAKGAIFAAAVFLGLSGAGAISAFALPGWDKSDGEWRYYDEQGVPTMQGWRRSYNNRWFYLGTDGYIMKNRLLQDGDKSYFLGADGVMVRNQWVEVTRDNTDNEERLGWYYFQEDGSAARRKDHKFLYDINGKSYAFNENGVMLTGWLDGDGVKVTDTDEPFMDGIYLAEDDGSVRKNGWYLYGSTLKPFHGDSQEKSRLTERDYHEYKELWLYFDENGKKIHSNDNTKLLEKTIKDKTYGFDENGVMDPWWSPVATTNNVSRSNPVSDPSGKLFSEYDGGKLLKNQWLWMYPSENIDETDYKNVECSWFRSREDGRVVKNRIREINGRKYAFDGIGRMKVGFVLFNNKPDREHALDDTRPSGPANPVTQEAEDRGFVANYDVDEWDSRSFKNGDLYGIEKADLYFFSPDEFNDGSMQTGKELKMTLADGIHTFGFRDNGTAYGNRNRMEKVDGRYYINGLRLEAEPEFGSGVVDVKDRNNNHVSYRAVNTSGSVLNGAHRVLKAGDGYLLIAANRVCGYVEDTDKAPRWNASGAGGAGFYLYDEDSSNHYGTNLFCTAAQDGYNISAMPEEMKINFD